MATRKPFHFSQQQHLKCLLRTLPAQQLKNALSKLRAVVGTQLEASCKMISYKCYEFTITYKSYKAFGYGRNETEAHINCIQNFLELLTEDESVFPLIKDMLTNGVGNETCGVVTTDKTNFSKDVFPGPQTVSDDTLALDSWPEKDYGTKELGNVSGLDTFKGNLGNISAIEQDLSLSASKLDVRDLLGNLVLNEKEHEKRTGHYQPKVLNRESSGMRGSETDRNGKEKRESFSSIKGNSQMSTGYLSRREMVSQENEKKTVELSAKRNLSEKAKEILNEYRKEQQNREAKGMSQEPRKENNVAENYKNYLAYRETKSLKEMATNESLTDRGKEKSTFRAEVSPKRSATPGDGNCDCHKYLLEAMSKWEKLEKEITKISEENKVLKQRLIAKHSNQSSTKTMRTGAITERHSDVPPIPRYLNCQSHRRLTYQPSSTGRLSVDKENQNRSNGQHAEEPVGRKTFDSTKPEKDILRSKGVMKEYRKPVMEESSLRKQILQTHRVEDRPREGSFTERSSSTSALTSRDANKDMGSQWSGRSHYYKRKNW